MSPREPEGVRDEVAERFHDLMGALDGPMVLVTTRDVTGERSGCLVGFATQCSIDPPRFVACLSNKNHTYRVAQRAERLAVHLLPAERHDLAALFGGETGDEVDKFAAVPWQDGPGGLPLLEGCPGWFVGRILDRMPFGDHVGYLLEPIAVGSGDGSVHTARLHDVSDLEPGHQA
jgi:flavin reductase (DIM6/NTAB) family NADH-FMN oxidoreductase RutF